MCPGVALLLRIMPPPAQWPQPIALTPARIANRASSIARVRRTRQLREERQGREEPPIPFVLLEYESKPSLGVPIESWRRIPLPEIRGTLPSDEDSGQAAFDFQSSTERGPDEPSLKKVSDLPVPRRGISGGTTSPGREISTVKKGLRWITSKKSARSEPCNRASASSKLSSPPHLHHRPDDLPLRFSWPKSRKGGKSQLPSTLSSQKRQAKESGPSLRYSRQRHIPRTF
jgi:hypothetical protein